MTVKGSHEPLGVFELDGLGKARSHFELSQARGLSKFVGRDAELAALEAALDRANAGNGLTVGIVAGPGTGKSRLCFEFLERCHERGIDVYAARGVAHGARIPLLPMLELFRGFFGVEETDSDEEARAKITAVLLRFGESLRDDLPIFFDMLGVPDPEHPLPPTDPEAVQRRVNAAIRAIVRAEGGRPLPAILLVEDLQWLDPASDGFVAEMIEAQATCRGLIVVNFRPGYKAAWMARSSYQQLPLVPLGQDAVRELLHDLLGSDPSVAGLSTPIYQRASGNPFFVEEIVHDLVETGALVGSRGRYRLRDPATVLTLPETVHAVLAARIDRLPSREKRLLEQAAVVGKSVQERILKRIAELEEADFRSALRTLREGDFLYEESVYPQVTYAFKHPLTHEVAYHTQVRDRRKQTHTMAARTIEAFAADRLDEEAALVAHHWEEAGEKLLAAHWHARAARWIGIRNYVQAFAHWRRVVDLIGDAAPPDDLALRAEAFCMLASIAYRTGVSDVDEAMLFGAGRAFLERLGDERSLAAFLLMCSTIRENVGDLRGYEEWTLEALRIAERNGEPALRAAVRVDRLYSLYRVGRLAEALAIADEVGTLTGGDASVGANYSGYSPFSTSLVLAGGILAEMGRLREARERAERGVRIALDIGSDESLCYVHLALCIVLAAQGDRSAAMAACGRTSLEAAERSGSPQALVCGHCAMVVASNSMGDWQPAIAAGEAALQITRTRPIGRDFEGWFVPDYAASLLGAGEAERAVAVCSEFVTLSAARCAPVDRCRALIVLARCLRAQDGVDAAERVSALLHEVDRLANETGAHYWQARVLLERAELYRLRNDSNLARRALMQAHASFANMGATGYAERTAAFLDEEIAAERY